MQPNAAHELRFAVDSLPRPARQALLEAVGQGDLLTGVYARGGQVCPSVAVHRLGPGERMAGFARAWDAYTGADPDASRQATAAEREGLRAMIERSLARREPDGGSLRAAFTGMAEGLPAVREGDEIEVHTAADPAPPRGRGRFARAPAPSGANGNGGPSRAPEPARRS